MMVIKIEGKKISIKSHKEAKISQLIWIYKMKDIIVTWNQNLSLLLLFD